MISSAPAEPPTANGPVPGPGRPDDPGPEPAGAPTRSRFLADDLATLWPGPGAVTLVKGPRLTRPSEGTSYAILPNARRPALLLPTHPGTVASAVLRSYKTSATALPRAKFGAIAFAARAGALRLMPSQVLVRDGTVRLDGHPTDLTIATDLVGHLRHVLGSDLHIAAYMGSPRANRKPVLQILGPGARTLAFAKVGTNVLTRTLVDHEAIALTFLSAHPMETVITPHVLHHGAWDGHRILVQEALGQRRKRGRVSSAVLERAMVEVAGISGVTTSPVKDSSYWMRLEQRISVLPTGVQAERLRFGLRELEGAAASAMTPFGAWHGDWTPWNMLGQGDQIELWDWERYEADVPAGFDSLHFSLQRAIAQGRSKGPGQARSAATMVVQRSPYLLAPFGTPPDAARLVAILYLLDLGARYLMDGQNEAGAALGDLQTWLLPVVASSSQRLRSTRP